MLTKTDLYLADALKKLEIQIKGKAMTDFDFFRYTLNLPRKCSPSIKTRGLNALRKFIQNYKIG